MGTSIIDGTIESIEGEDRDFVDAGADELLKRVAPSCTDRVPLLATVPVLPLYAVWALFLATGGGAYADARVDHAECHQVARLRLGAARKPREGGIGRG